MNSLFTVTLTLHLVAVCLTVLLFICRFYWKTVNSPMLHQRWVKITPHINDTILLLSGVSLIFITHYLPFTEDGSWLTEKLFAVVLYIGLGVIAFGRRNFSQFTRGIAFCAALLTLGIILWLAINRVPLLGML